MSARLAVALLAVLLASDAIACSCGRTTPGQVFDEATQVLLVRILATENVRAREPLAKGVHFVVGVNYGVRARFELLESFKGDASAVAALATGHGGGDCGVDLAPGTTWLVSVRENRVVAACGIARQVDPTSCAWPALRNALRARAEDGTTAIAMLDHDALREGSVACD